jgi:hypothetical protein
MKAFVPMCGKEPFTSEAEAVRFHHLASLLPTSAYQVVAQHPYLCHECGFWHLTSQPPGEMRRRRLKKKHRAA